MLCLYFLLETDEVRLISQLLATHSPMHNSLMHRGVHSKKLRDKPHFICFQKKNCCLLKVIRTAGDPNLAQSREGKADSLRPSL